MVEEIHVSKLKYRVPLFQVIKLDCLRNFVLCPRHPDLLWDQPSSLLNVFWALFRG